MTDRPSPTPIVLVLVVVLVLDGVGWGGVRWGGVARMGLMGLMRLMGSLRWAHQSHGSHSCFSDGLWTGTPAYPAPGFAGARPQSVICHLSFRSGHALPVSPILRYITRAISKLVFQFVNSE